MISFAHDNCRFGLRAAVVVVHEGYVLLHRLEGDEFWALPGGRVEMGEDAAAAVRRELKEELSVNVQCGPLLYVAENFFTTGNEQRHEVGLYFAAALPQQSSLLDKTAAHCGVEVHQRLDFQWFSLVGLDEVDLRPAFLKEALRTSSKTVTHVVQRD